MPKYQCYPCRSRANNSHGARFTDDDVRLIRSLHGEGWTYKAIAERVGCSISGAWHIANRQSRANVPDAAEAAATGNPIANLAA